MALRPLTPAEHEAVGRMKRYQLIVLGIVLCTGGALIPLSSTSATPIRVRETTVLR